MMPRKMVIATILSSAARAIAIFLLSLLLKLNDDLYWVLPWLRQMTIRIEVVFFIFLIQCGGSSIRGAPSIHVASLSPTRVYCFHFNCAIEVAGAAAASKAAADGMVEAGSNAYILVPWLAAAARVALGAALWARASKNVKKLQNHMCE
jgi:chromate transport protein ChrA